MDGVSTAELGATPEQPLSNKLRRVIKEIRARALPHPEKFLQYGTTYTYEKKLFNGREINWPVSDYDPAERRCYNFLIGVYPMRYLLNNPKTQKIIDTLADKSRQERLENLEEGLPHIRNYVGGHGYSFYIESKDLRYDANDRAQSGRIFINPRPEQMHRAFWELSKLMNAHPEIPFQLKMFNPRNVDGITPLDLNRADKIVFYFKAPNQAQVLDIMRGFYNGMRPQAFEDVTPKLAAQLKGADGVLMRGIGFGQEPDPNIEGREISFNNHREGIFVDLYERDGVSPDAPDYEEQVVKRFKKLKVDPSNPAFNYPPEVGTKLFSVIAANSN